MLTSLSDEKLKILDAIAIKNNVFITGGAGTGKSYLLKIIREEYGNVGLHITASTGIAAVHIGGVTIHSWAGIGLGTTPLSEILNYIDSGKGTLLRRKLQKARMLAIDEISMISANIFSLLDSILKHVKKSSRAFGGIQLILLGDFLQLPPIVNDNDAQKFCFESDSWKNADLKIFCLKEIYRQENIEFANLLTRMRVGKLNENDIKILSSRVINDYTSNIRPTIIVTHNKQVDFINQKELKILDTKEVIYDIKTLGTENKLAFLKKNCLAAEKLVLKKGAQVMMLKNNFHKDGIINGSIGIIQDFSKERLPIVKFSNGKIKEIPADDWIIEEFNHDKLIMEVKARITQIPLMLAWAITVHKSQGMTLDAIECDLKSAFEEGQAYVAISRVKFLENLYLKSFNPNIIKVNPKLVDFYRDLE